ncbi:MAG: hypothetical protein Q7R50_06540 [Dehalococcoidales bacterium]|nr:hypothetical protein [Dehalococcoidales bacterium]
MKREPEHDMKLHAFVLTENRDPRIMGLIGKIDHKTLAVWAIDCAERVLPWFEQQYPEDHRPRNAIKTLREWIATGKFRMAVIRKASLDSHAAARDVGEDNAARSAARAAGQAVATAHVADHAVGSAIYALQAVFRNAGPAEAEAAVAAEKEWQYRHLLELDKTHDL